MRKLQIVIIATNYTSVYHVENAMLWEGHDVRYWFANKEEIESAVVGGEISSIIAELLKKADLVLWNDCSSWDDKSFGGEKDRRYFAGAIKLANPDLVIIRIPYDRNPNIQIPGVDQVSNRSKYMVSEIYQWFDFHTNYRRNSS